MKIRKMLCFPLFHALLFAMPLCWNATRALAGEVYSSNIVGYRTEAEKTLTTEIRENIETNASMASSGVYCFTQTNGIATLVDYTGTNYTLTVPAMLDGLPVKAVGAKVEGIADLVVAERGLFAAREHLRRVVIPEGVADINHGAFAGCANLAELNIAEGVTNIGWYAFWDCSSLTNLPLPNTLKTIGDWAFGDCAALASITIPDSVTIIGDSAFAGCTHLNGIFVKPANLKYSSVDGVMFDKAKTLLLRCPEGKSGRYSLPDGVTRIDSMAFSGCTGLTRVTLPNGVEQIGRGAFSGCTGLTDVALPNSLISIYDSAFIGCSLLARLVIPGSVTCIGASAFDDCPSLDRFSVMMDSKTFKDVDGVLLSHDETKLIRYPMGNKRNRYAIPASVSTLADGAFSGTTALADISIPESVTVMGSSAFSGCSNLTTIAIPRSVTSIGGSAFDNCPSLARLTVADDNAAFKSVDGVLLSRDGARLIRFPMGGTQSRYAIPDSVTTIGNGAFYGCSGLTNLLIGTNVTKIEDSAFSSCTNLTGVYFEGNLPIFGNYMFLYDHAATVYYRPGTQGWGKAFGGLPTAEWKE